MQLKLTEPIDWANNAGYEVIDINDGYRENIKLVFSPYPAFQVGNIEIASTAYKNPIYIKAKNVKIVVINNDQNESTHNYKYFLISSNNDLLIDDQINRKHWLKYFNVFNEIDGKKIDFDLNNISIKHKIKIKSINIDSDFDKVKINDESFTYNFLVVGLGANKSLYDWKEQINGINNGNGPEMGIQDLLPVELKRDIFQQVSEQERCLQAPDESQERPLDYFEKIIDGNRFNNQNIID